MCTTQTLEFRYVSMGIPLHERIGKLSNQRGKVVKKLSFQNIYDWRLNHPLQDDEKWGAKLRSLGIDENNFNELLYFADAKKQIYTEREINLQNFLLQLIEIAEKSEYSVNPQSYKAESSEDRIDFGYIFPPLLNYIEELLKQAIGNDPLLLDYNRYIQQCLGYINIVVKKELAPALIIEYNSHHKKGLLSGKTKEEKFQDFAIKVTSNPEWIDSFFRKYPVLLYTVWKIIKNGVKNYSIMTHRILTDYILLVEHDFIDFDDKIISIEWPVGDLHCNGEATSIVHFANDKKIVYKPRGTENEILFSQFLRWLTESGYYLPLKGVDVLPQKEYGWVKFVEHTQCSTQNDVEHFYERQGTYLAILYFLGGHDFISDNVIACAKHPVLIDLECLLAPPMPYANSNYTFSSVAGQRFYDSVIRVGLLPQWAAGDTNSPGLNLGGISRLDKENIVNRITWAYDKQGQIFQKIKKTKVQSFNEHLPKLNGKTEEIKDYTHYFIYGFTNCYKFIEERKHEILAYGTIFKGAKTRILFRHTNVYDRICNETRHPDYLTDALKKDRLLDYYWAAYDDIEMPSSIISSEIKQVWGCDIPYFYTYNDSNGVWDAYGNPLSNDFFEQTGFELFKERVKNSCEEDLKFQISIINRSLSIFEDYSPLKDIKLTNFSITPNEHTISKSDLIETAKKIADEILEQGLEDDTDISWIDIAVGKHGEWQQTVKPMGVYDGTDGIALFFLYLYKLTLNDRYKIVVEKLLNRSLYEFEKITSKDSKGRLNFSPMLFPCSSLYLLNHAHSFFPKKWDLNFYMGKFSRWLENNLHYDNYFDFNNGIAGTINLLLDVYAKTKDENVKMMAIVCGKHLLENGKEMDIGVAWEGPKLKFLGGFAHGTSAFAWTLIRLGKELDMDEFSVGGLKALAYDQSFYDAEINAWRDGRHSNNNITSCAWCHGSAGIVLSRLLLSGYVNNPMLNVELKSGLKHIVDKGFSLSHCICHGQVGNLEVLYAIAKYTNDKHLKYSVNQHLKILIENFNSGGKWKCGMSERNIDLYSLFMGITGIGYAMLRFADWENIPSVLALEGPITNKRVSVLH